MKTHKLEFGEPEIQALFGHEAAEDEDPARLRSYYFKSSTYDQVATDLPLRVLVGHKGIGKSALFQVAMAEDAGARRLTVLIKPDDIADLGTDPSDFLKTVRSWKVGLIEIIARKVFRSVGQSGDEVIARVGQFGGNVLDFFRATFRPAVQGEVNFTPADKLVIEQFLKQGVITVYIDDLDRGWQGRREDVARISALLNAVRDVANENHGIRFRISLRSDVYYLVRTSDESTDKVEGSVIWQTWTNHEIFVLLVKRLETFFGRTVDEEKLLNTRQAQLARYLDPVMDSRFEGSGHWRNAPMYRVLMSLIRKRPRDLVKLCTLAARSARETKGTKIRTANFKAIFAEYSLGRIQDTVNEFRSELPDVERLVFSMKPNRQQRLTRLGYVYSTPELLEKLHNASQTGEYRFSRTPSRRGEPGVSGAPSGPPASRRELAAFLYKINFLTARKETPAGIVRRYFEENRYLSNEFVDFGFDWEVHPAYRWALQPDNVQDIFATLELSAESRDEGIIS